MNRYELAHSEVKTVLEENGLTPATCHRTADVIVTRLINRGLIQSTEGEADLTPGGLVDDSHT